MSIARLAHHYHWPMGWWRSAMWSDLRVALVMMAEQRAADEAALEEARSSSPRGGSRDQSSGGFGTPPPDHVLALLPKAGD